MSSLDLARVDRRVRVAAALLLPLVTGMVLVAVRGTIDRAAIAVVIACSVVGGARIGGRAGGIGAALVAAVTFDFFHTVPYHSLKIANTEDVVVTLALLVVGLIVGGLAGAMSDAREATQRRFRSSAAVTRVLTVARDGPLEDVMLAVRAELIELLALEDCSFTRQPVDLPVLARDGSWGTEAPTTASGHVLLASTIAVPVAAHGNRLGSLVCASRDSQGVPAANWRTAYALGEVLGLALSAQDAA